jgi:hypothetical protein
VAFSDAIRGGGRDIGTVTLTADTGQFNAQIEQAERQWRESVGQMSREALKLDLAQDRLRSSLAKYGAESNQAKRATIGLKDAEEAAARAADRSTREHAQLAAAHDRQRRSIMGLRGSVVGLAASFGGAYGLVSLLKSAVGAQREAELVIGQTRIAVENAGQSWDEYADTIDRVIKAQSRLGFDDEALLKTFSLFVTRTGQVEQSLRLNALAADVARGRYISLEQAANLVLKASLGQAGALRRVGIEAEKGADAAELLALLTEKYAGRAEAAAKTGVAAQDRLNVAWENAKEIVGAGLAPAVNDLADRMSEWLESGRNQEKLQRTVNDLVETGTEVVRGFAGAVRAIKTALDPVVNALGGTENAVRTLLTLLAVSKLIAIARAVRGIGAAFGLVGVQAATASRNIQAVGTQSTIAAGKVRGLGGALAGLGAFAAAGVAAAAAGSQIEGKIVKRNGRYYAIDERGNTYGEVSEETVRKVAPELLVQSGSASNFRAGAPERTAATTTAATTTSAAGQDTAPRTTADFELDVARAQASGDTVAERRLLTRRQSFLNRQIRRLEADKTLTAKQKDRLTRLYSERERVEAELERIASEAEAASALRVQTLAERREKREQERQARLDARRERLELGVLHATRTKRRLDDDAAAQRRLVAFLKQRVAEARRTGIGLRAAWEEYYAALDQLDETEAEIRRRRAEKRRRDRVVSPPSGGFTDRGTDTTRQAVRDANRRATQQGDLTREQVAGQIRAFLDEFQRVQSRYGSNMVVNQTFNTQSDPDPSHMMRGARYAAFALRAGLEG